MNLEDEKRRLQENGLLRREGSLRRSRIGAVLLGILLVFAVIPVNGLSSRAGASPDTAKGFAGSILLVAVLGYQHHLQVKHIESIKMYRRQLDDLKAQQQPGKTEAGEAPQQSGGG